jgi:hypothetical protein
MSIISAGRHVVIFTRQFSLIVLGYNKIKRCQAGCGFITYRMIADGELIQKYKQNITTSFEVFTAVVFKVEFLWVVTPCSVVVGHRRFGEHAAFIFIRFRELIYNKSIKLAAV